MFNTSKSKANEKCNGEILDNKEKFTIEKGHVRVNTQELLRSEKVRAQIEKIREIFN